MVWMGVDLGEARVGLALSDPELTFAHPEGNIEVHGDSFHALDAVIGIIEENDVDVVVVGLPLMLDGSVGASGKKATRWGRNLSRRVEDAVASNDWHGGSAPQVVMRDERLTTVMAHDGLRSAGIAERWHRARVDQQSAVLILQSALDARSQEERDR
ncbi:Holliday junction resolvase RuvX [uncultured Bifidobacterium sp.]|uniref:Holliday junction resolvase RuvX n=1 Tax=uncultured Bifidobacterium sp. TaxID=165187 RepID=UPI002612FAFC|nr:Holliday junction resolvase RuvX [uncultured Bifidobacterium sp.]